MNRKTSTTLLSCVLVTICTVNLLWTKPALASEPFLGQIEYYAFNFAPRGWAKCDGQLLPINQNQSLFSLLGSTYGGDGRTSFALPDMRGRVPVHAGNSTGAGLMLRVLGAKGGAENVTLSVAQMPSHHHGLQGTTSTGNQTKPAGNSLAEDGVDETYSDVTPNVSMDNASIDDTGGNSSHNNMPPFLAINCSIALQGLFPSRN